MQDARYVRLISWTLQSGSEQLLIFSLSLQYYIWLRCSHLHKVIFLV
jgi:hypothetical protein